MELDARRMNTALHLRCCAVSMRRASSSIRCSCEKPISRYIFVCALGCPIFQYYLMVTIGFISGVGTKIDPTLCRADRMVGQVLGAVGALPEIYTELVISYFLLRRLLGVRTEGDKKAAKVSV